MKKSTRKIVNYVLGGNIKVIPYVFRREDERSFSIDVDNWEGKVNINEWGNKVVPDGLYNTFKEGFMIHNEQGEQFVLCYDDEHQCCETFEVSESSNIFDFTSEKGCEIEVEFVRAEPTPEDWEKLDDHDRFKGWIVVKIIVDGETKAWKKISNSHNGYYSHAVVYGSIDEKNGCIMNNVEEPLREYTYISL